MKSRDFNVGGIVGKKQDWAVENVIRVKNLCAGEAIPPSLTVAVDDARAVDLDISECC
jgi:hypothetical protein